MKQHTVCDCRACVSLYTANVYHLTTYAYTQTTVEKSLHRLSAAELALGKAKAAVEAKNREMELLAK